MRVNCNTKIKQKKTPFEVLPCRTSLDQFGQVWEVLEDGEAENVVNLGSDMTEKAFQPSHH